VFTETWLESGDRMRAQVHDDLAFVSALRLFLPAYAGPGLTLFCGDSFWDSERLSYGVSWCTDRERAKRDALAARRRLGGSVLLETNAPPEAIVFAPSSGRGDERRHVVDRRLLHEVTMVERLADATLADLANQRSALARSAGSPPSKADPCPGSGSAASDGG
jgi:hypothetical protein